MWVVRIQQTDSEPEYVISLWNAGLECWSTLLWRAGDNACKVFGFCRGVTGGSAFSTGMAGSRLALSLVGFCTDHKCIAYVHQFYLAQAGGVHSTVSEDCRVCRVCAGAVWMNTLMCLLGRFLLLSNCVMLLCSLSRAGCFTPLFCTQTLLPWCISSMPVDKVQSRQVHIWGR